jgi:hypothetical protein
MEIQKEENIVWFPNTEPEEPKVARTEYGEKCRNRAYRKNYYWTHPEYRKWKIEYAKKYVLKKKETASDLSST